MTLFLKEKKTKHLNNALPFEILKKIFQNFIGRKGEKENIKTCLSVCKSWQVAALDLYPEVSIKIYEDSLEKLSKDIVYFGQSVKRITLMQGSSSGFDRPATCLFWFNIVSACRNLVSIQINVLRDSSYVRCLIDTKKKVLYPARSFETLSLQLNNDKSFPYFISHFPNLTSFSANSQIEYINPAHVVDIMQLLQAAPLLQKLDVCRFKEIKSKSTTTISENLRLTVLNITVEEMDINSLLCIMKCLKKLKHLFLDINNLITDVPQRRFGKQKEFNVEELLDDLKNFRSGILYSNLRFRHQKVTYILQNNGEPFLMTDNERRNLRCLIR